ncbi:TRAP transporter small permease [Paracoccus sp. MC1854]|uniref:TRAP transporter small permease n=1 Tax=Paracoccus sp. MC1854 TaxID=2760306 RepID=UPI002104D1D3|nr:TRAP transporter small permease [Paracoccus sp. MC1854]
MFIALSESLLRLERYGVALLMTLLSGAILLNGVTRYLGMPIYWIDEFAVYCMVWLTFFGASAMTRLRLDFSVTMMTERLSQRMRDLCRVVATGMVMVFSLALVAMCWIWLDPVGIAAAGFDARAFSGSTFNFVYTERTQTLGWPTWVLYLILPIFAISVTVHGLANLLEDLGMVEKTSRDLVINAEEAVN